MNAKQFFKEYKMDVHGASEEQVEDIIDDLDEIFEIMIDFAEAACMKQRNMWSEILSKEIYEDTYGRIIPILHENWVNIQVEGNKRVRLDK